MCPAMVLAPCVSLRETRGEFPCWVEHEFRVESGSEEGTHLNRSDEAQNALGAVRLCNQKV